MSIVAARIRGARESASRAASRTVWIPAWRTSSSRSATEMCTSGALVRGLPCATPPNSRASITRSLIAPGAQQHPCRLALRAAGVRVGTVDRREVAHHIRDVGMQLSLAHRLRLVVAHERTDHTDHVEVHRRGHLRALADVDRLEDVAAARASAAWAFDA